MTPYQGGGRCVCACPRDQHDHYRTGADCGHCGKVTCPRFIPLTARDNAILSTGQRLALAESDVRFYRNLMALSSFALSRPAAPVRRRKVATEQFIPIPAQRRPSEPMTPDRSRARQAAFDAQRKYGPRR